MAPAVGFVQTAPVSDTLSDTAPSAIPDSGPSVTPAPTVNALTMDEATLRRIVREEVQGQIAPLRQTLALESAKGYDWKNIVGGIGWLFGIAGLYSILRQKSRTEKKG